MNNSSSTDSEANIEHQKNRRIQPIRKAKSTGDITRQLTSFIDNASSSSTDNPSSLSVGSASSSSIEMNDDNHNNVMVSSPSTARDAESWSSTSPPRAPAPPPIVVDLPSFNIANPLADMLQKQEQIQREQQLLQLEEAKLKQDIQKYLSNLSKNCFIDFSINRVMCDERVLIKLFDELAPMTCHAFRAICNTQYGFNYENSQLNYLLPNQFIKGGQLIIYNSEGVRLPDRTGPKEKSAMVHDRKGLVSMDPTKSLNEFIITLGSAPILNDNYIVIGEIISGMSIFETINDHGVRGLTDTDGGGEPIDSICIYSCGEM